MSLFKGIVKLTEEQYLTLKGGGTITNDLGTFTFDENVLYVTDRDYTQMKTKIVETLPNVGEINTIYMVLKEGSFTDYNRYMYINDRYTLIGETTIDLAGYAKLDDIPTSLPASDVYDWAKQPNKPSYSVSELPGELLTSSKADIGNNSTLDRLSFSVTRNIDGVVNQGLLSIYDDGSVRISHRNKGVDANVDDCYIEFNGSTIKYGEHEILTSSSLSTLVPEIEATLLEDGSYSLMFKSNNTSGDTSGLIPKFFTTELEDGSFSLIIETPKGG